MRQDFTQLSFLCHLTKDPDLEELAESNYGDYAKE